MADVYCCPAADSAPRAVCSIMMVKMAWLRDEASFMRVAPVARDTLPLSSSRCRSAAAATGTSRMPDTQMAPSARSRMEIALLGVSGCSRSRTSSFRISMKAHRTAVAATWRRAAGMLMPRGACALLRAASHGGRGAAPARAPRRCGRRRR